MGFSQFGEDEIVARIFGPRIGHLIEIGAWGVRDFSNSRLLIENGWSATLIEFSPCPVDALVREYGYNDRVRVIQAAITAGERSLEQFEITQDALSTNDPEVLAQWRNMASDGTVGDNRGGYYGRLWVPTLSVRKLLDQFFGDVHPDFASIDTEGSSVSIALALMATDWRPKVACVEYNNQLPYLLEQAQQWEYKAVYTNSTNVILER